MRWITREDANVDRVACSWLIERFVDPDTEFVHAPADEVLDKERQRDTIPNDIKDVALGHVDGRCPFESIMLKYDLLSDSALVDLAKVVHTADLGANVDTFALRPRAPSGGRWRRLPPRKEDDRKIERETPMYRALYAFFEREGAAAPSA